jgi:hypothetical protein
MRGGGAVYMAGISSLKRRNIATQFRPLFVSNFSKFMEANIVHSPLCFRQALSSLRKVPRPNHADIFVIQPIHKPPTMLFSSSISLEK